MVQYGKFVLDDLFSITGTKSTDAGKVSFVKNGDAQFVGRTSAGYGIQGMVNSADMGFDPNEANTISVSQVGTIVAQYRDFPYYTSQNITKFSADFLNPEVGLYFCGIINDWLGKAGFVGYHTVKQRDLKKQVVLLPVTPAGDPDFEYMTMQIRELEAERIRELEAERIRELEAYLHVTGLDDTTLSASEAQALTQDVKWKKFKVGDVFDIHPTKTYKLTNRKLMDENGKTPVLTNTSSNNGIGGWSNLESTEKSMMITYSDTTTGADTVFVQTKPFIGYSHVQGLYSKIDHEWNVRELLYIAVTLKAAIGDGWSYATKLNREIVSNLDMLLPVTSDDQIDFDYMQNYIRATEKQTIKGVVKYKDRVIEETKKVVNG